MTNEAMREKLVNVANLLKDLTMAVVSVADEFGEVKVVETKAPAEEKPKEAPAKKYSMEDERKVLAEKSSAGFTAEVRALLEKHGGAKLSAIAETEYAAIMEEAKEIG